ncbi:MAG: HD domain-containing protein [Planctomycetota bacterium]
MSPKVIRDAVHGDMELGDADLAVLDTPEVQRMRGIRQLGTARLIYPSANHTRFDHSLGTAHLARKILASIEANSDTRFEEEEHRLATLAGLCHDVTHIPYGHTIEDERRLFERHDTPERIEAVVGHGELGKTLRQLGCLKEILAILGARKKSTAVRPFLKELICGTICADLLDYLARDSLFCGLAQRYDERIFRYFRIQDDHLVLTTSKDGLLREDALSEIIALLRLRYTLSERVYFHHAKVSSGAMVSKLVEIGLRHGLVLEDLFWQMDDSLLPMLRSRFGRDPELDRVALRVERRRLYKRCFVLTRRIGPEQQARLIEQFHRDHAQRGSAERSLEKATGLDSGDVIVYCPSAGMALKEADIPVLVDSDQVVELSALRLPEIDVLLDKHRDLWKFYVFLAPDRVDRLDKLSRAAEEYFGFQNELGGLRSGQKFFRF